MKITNIQQLQEINARLKDDKDKSDKWILLLNKRVAEHKLGVRVYSDSTIDPVKRVETKEELIYLMREFYCYTIKYPKIFKAIHGQGLE